MGKYVYVYYAGEEDTDAGDNEAYGKWFGALGEKLVDAGNPLGGGGKAVSQGGVMDIQDKPVIGYSIINADSMDEATELAKDCPLVVSKGGAVCVYEALSM